MCVRDSFFNHELVGCKVNNMTIHKRWCKYNVSITRVLRLSHTFLYNIVHTATDSFYVLITYI